MGVSKNVFNVGVAANRENEVIEDYPHQWLDKKHKKDLIKKTIVEEIP